MNYSPEALTEAANKGKAIPKLNKATLEKAYNYFRDNNQIKPSQTELMLVIKSVDYPDFINDEELRGWFTRNTHNESYKLGLVGQLGSITVFSDIFLDFSHRVLTKNVLFVMPNAA